VLIISAQRHRTQERNRQDARERLIELIRRAAIAPIPRRATKADRGLAPAQAGLEEASAPPSRACGRPSQPGVGWNALKLTVFIAAALGLPSLACDAQEVADFYKGKQIAICGGLYAGRKLEPLCPGARPSHGTLPSGQSESDRAARARRGRTGGANNVYNTAPRDGTTFAITGRTVAIEPLLGNKNAKFDARQFNWIGTANVEYTTCALWHTAKGEDAAGRPEHRSHRRRVRR
jgi:hypothetical protein